MDNVGTCIILGGAVLGLFGVHWRNHSTGAAGRLVGSFGGVFGLAQDDI